MIQDLARILVPINFTREARFRHDPAATIPPLPTLAAAPKFDHLDATTLGFALNQLTRGQNWVVAALRSAARHIDLVTVKGGPHVSHLVGDPARPQGEQGTGG